TNDHARNTTEATATKPRPMDTQLANKPWIGAGSGCGCVGGGCCASVLTVIGVLDYPSSQPKIGMITPSPTTPPPHHSRRPETWSPRPSWRAKAIPAKTMTPPITATMMPMASATPATSVSRLERKSGSHGRMSLMNEVSPVWARMRVDMDGDISQFPSVVRAVAVVDALVEGVVVWVGEVAAGAPSSARA